MTEEEIKEDLYKAVECLQSGGIILYPTDTIWGVGCDATNPKAVDRLFEIKQRPDSKAMISLVDSLPSLSEWVKYIPDNAIEELLNSERPTTVILNGAEGISKKLMANDGSAAFRIPNYFYVASLCKLLGKPLVSTSANISGRKAPAIFDEIDDIMKSKSNYTCMYGRDKLPSQPSRIVKFDSVGKIEVIRE